jgi:dimethylhistidine N-methyltransferase
MAHLEMDNTRWQLYAMDTVNHQVAFAKDVAEGLTAARKSLLPKYFYDDDGARLYEQICQLPEYYLYRAEQEILTTYAAEIYAEIGHLALVELGPGNAAKTRRLLTQYEQAGRPFLYCPVDIARSMLLATVHQLLTEYRYITIRAMYADFAGNARVIRALHVGPKAVAFFGSSLGNFTAEQSVDFLKRTADILTPDDVLLLGLDLKKSAALLVPAYDDAQGVTAAFNLNLLRRINRELGGNFDLQRFAHVALYNDVQGRIEMHLRSRIDHQVMLARLGQTVSFKAGETIHTENSYKYSVEEVRQLGRRVNLHLQRTWFDSQQYFLLALFRLQG